MRVAVLQSAYIPWRGYFDIIASVDLFVIYDDVQYSKGTWRNRNRLKFADGLRWLTVPVEVSLGQTIETVRIAAGKKSWFELHATQIKDSLATCSFFEDAWEVWQPVASKEFSHLSQLNIALLQSACNYLGIKTKIVLSTEYKIEGRSTDRLLQLLRMVGATSYLSGPAADDYLDKAAFAAQKIELLYKSYVYPDYQQRFGAFQPSVAILDLIANCGIKSRNLIRSTTPDQIVVP